MRISVRAYLLPLDCETTHAFVVGSEVGGLTPPIGTIPFVPDETTLADARRLVEYQGDRGMQRRTIMYQELQQRALSSCNPFHYGFVESRKFYLAFFASEQDEIPRVVPVDGEEATLLKNFIDYRGSGIRRDIIIVPQSQVGPGCQQCCRGCAKCDEAMKLRRDTSPDVGGSTEQS